MNSPMPLCLDAVTWFKVTDSHGRTLRAEELKPGADLHDRLRLAHRNYQLQGWTVDALLPGRWNFCASKGGRQIVVGIRLPTQSRSNQSHSSLPIPVAQLDGKLLHRAKATSERPSPTPSHSSRDVGP